LDESFGETSKVKEEVDESRKGDLACQTDKERFGRADIDAEGACMPSGGFDKRRGLAA